MRQDDLGASAVLATVLLVAIVAAIAGAVAFVGYNLVQGHETERPDLIGMVPVPGEPSARVVLADPELDWFVDFRVAGSCEPLLNGGPFPTAEGTFVRSSDVLSCSAGEDLRVLHRGDTGDTVLYSFRF